jgi:predicted secreted protein
VKAGSILAIYALFLVMSFFVVLPFGVRTDEEAGVERLPGMPRAVPTASASAGLHFVQ